MSLEGVGRRVLVVDDEESIRELLTKTLALAEYEAQAVSDGKAGLESCGGSLGTC